MTTPKESQTGYPAETPAPGALSIPFVARLREIAGLQELHAKRKHALIVGPPGVGKSALVAHLRDGLALLVSPRSEHWGEICGSLEPQVGLDPRGQTLFHRRQRLREALRGAGRTVVFDGVGWTTPKLSSFFERVAEETPVWICARSDHPWDIGHFWPMLARFDRVELHAFQLPETREAVEAAVQRRLIPPESLSIIGWLHRRSGGSPLVLHELFQELATGKYDLSSPYGLRRLDLDRRIHEVFPVT